MQVDLAALGKGAVGVHDTGRVCRDAVGSAPAIDAVSMPLVRGLFITLDCQIKHGWYQGLSSMLLDRPKCTAPSAAHVLKRCWHKSTLLPQEEGPAARKAQASSSSNAPAGVLDAGSTAPDVPTDAGGSAPSVRQDEVSAMEETSTSAVVTET